MIGRAACKGEQVFDRSFDKRVRKGFSKRGWNIFPSTINDFILGRDIFVVHVLLGPELFDRRFPAVGNVLSKRIDACKAWGGHSVLVVISDRATLPSYQDIQHEGVAVVHLDDLDLLENLDIEALIAETLDEGALWGAEFVKQNAETCRQLGFRAGGLGRRSRALFWAERAVAAKPGDPLNHYLLAITRLAVGDAEGAAAAIATAIDNSPASATFLHQASLIESSRGDLDAALRFAQGAVAAVDRRPVDYHQLATIHIKRSELDLSEKPAKMAVTLSPDNPQFVKMLQNIQASLARQPDPAG